MTAGWLAHWLFSLRYGTGRITRIEASEPSKPARAATNSRSISGTNRLVLAPPEVATGASAFTPPPATSNVPTTPAPQLM